MSFPQSHRIEPSILQELKATGGEERLRFLYTRLIPYFPQLTGEDLRAKTQTGKNKWRILVYRAGHGLVEKGELKRSRGRWKLTDKGRQRAEEESVVIELSSNPNRTAPSHDEIKKRLVEIGRMLGKYAEEEYQRYDAIWKESELSPRISTFLRFRSEGK